MIETEKVKIRCHLCNEQSIAELTWGNNKGYQNDFELECPKCENWEIGQLPTQTFSILEKSRAKIIF